MLIYLDDNQGKELLDLLNTEDAFGTLSKCLKQVIASIKTGLEQYETYK